MLFFFLISRDPENFVEIARWPRFTYEISRALVSYWHPPKLLLPTRLHSNTSFCLLSFFYLLETLELHLVARRLSPGGPSRGTPLVMESSTSTPTSLRSPFAREPKMYSTSSTTSYIYYRAILGIYPQINLNCPMHCSSRMRKVY